MDWAAIGLLLSGIAGIVGIVWTIYAARRTSKKQETAVLMRDARIIIDSYKEKSEQQERELAEQRREIERLKWRIARLERRNRKLMLVLPKEELLKLQDDDGDEDAPARGA